MHIIILSIVEGITEFLPISSTGHLIIASRILDIPTTDFLKTFEIAIQSGAVLAVLNLYWKKLAANYELIWKALLALIPILVIGAILYPLIRDVFLESIQIVSIMLILGGIVMLVLERYLQKRNAKETTTLLDITYKQALFTGLTQSTAVIPGVSRAAASIFGGMVFRMDRKTATEFSFILALPAIIAATGFDLLQTAPTFDTSQIIYLLLGIALSFVIALLTIKWFLRYISTHSFAIFAWYRIIVGIIVFLMFL